MQQLGLMGILNSIRYPNPHGCTRWYLRYTIVVAVHTLVAAVNSCGCSTRCCATHARDYSTHLVLYVEWLQWNRHLDLHLEVSRDLAASTRSLLLVASAGELRTLTL